MENIKAVCNWTRIGGCDWTQAIQTQFVEDEMIKPDNDTLLKEERAILLHRKMRVDTKPHTSNCELELSLSPRFKVSALNLICTVPKMEIFLGAQNEYYETEHGSLIDDVSTEEIENSEGPRSYRYDIEIEKSGITELTLKLLTSDDEICIFAILLQIAPNPNGVTTLLPNSINLENVHKMLENSNQKLTSNAEKLKQFLETYGKAYVTEKEKEKTPLYPTTSTNVLKLKEVEGSDAMNCKLKAHIDERIQIFEAKILARLDAFEAQQSAKLDEILKTLQLSK